MKNQLSSVSSISGLLLALLKMLLEIIRCTLSVVSVISSSSSIRVYWRSTPLLVLRLPTGITKSAIGIIKWGISWLTSMRTSKNCPQNWSEVSIQTPSHSTQLKYDSQSMLNPRAIPLSSKLMVNAPSTILICFFLSLRKRSLTGSKTMSVYALLLISRLAYLSFFPIPFKICIPK